MSEITHKKCTRECVFALRNDSTTVFLFGRCPLIHMVIVGPVRYLAFIKCTASDPFRLSVRLQESLSHPIHVPRD